MAGGKLAVRPAVRLALLLLVLLAVDAVCLHQARLERQLWRTRQDRLATLTAALGLTDLCLATEARYTRNPAVSDPLAPFMDGPASLEHFPTGSFWAYPETKGEAAL